MEGTFLHKIVGYVFALSGVHICFFLGSLHQSLDFSSSAKRKSL